MTSSNSKIINSYLHVMNTQEINLSENVQFSLKTMSNKENTVELLITVSSSKYSENITYKSFKTNLVLSLKLDKITLSETTLLNIQVKYKKNLELSEKKYIKILLPLFQDNLSKIVRPSQLSFNKLLSHMDMIINF